MRCLSRNFLVSWWPNDKRTAILFIIPRIVYLLKLFLENFTKKKMENRQTISLIWWNKSIAERKIDCDGYPCMCVYIFFDDLRIAFLLSNVDKHMSARCFRRVLLFFSFFLEISLLTCVNPLRGRNWLSPLSVCVLVNVTISMCNTNAVDIHMNLTKHVKKPKQCESNRIPYRGRIHVVRELLWHNQTACPLSITKRPWQI